MIKKVSNLTFSIYLLISAIIFSTLLTLNISPIIYSLFINSTNLVEINNLTREELMTDYLNIISYLNHPNKNELIFENFAMSPNGAYHFLEVKLIFSSVYLIGIACLLLFIFLFISRKKFNLKFSFKALNLFFYEVISICSLILIAFYFNFSKVFTVFHKILFNNNYWIFNRKTDPIINALPESYFMTLGVFALVAIILIAILSKLIYISKTKNYKK